jgi:hypothetical protein
MSFKRIWPVLALLLAMPFATAGANVITDWDEKAVSVVQTKMAPPAGYRIMAIMHLAMFEAVNSVEPRYKPYKAKLSAAPDASKEAAAATAAATVLSKLVPDAAADVQAAAKTFLATCPMARPRRMASSSATKPPSPCWSCARRTAFPRLTVIGREPCPASMSRRRSRSARNSRM